MKRIGVLLIAIFLTGCDQSPPHEDTQAKDVDVNSLEASASPPNILLILGDDFGVETLAKYRIGNPVAHTPVLNRLAEEGMIFENFYTPSTCTPTRAAILTGRYGFRTGVNMPIPEAWYLYDELTPPPVPPGANKEIIIDPRG